MRLPRAILAVAAAALAAMAALAARTPNAVAELGRDPLPSSVIFPTQQIPLSFSHVLHLQREKMDCAFCHEDAPTSTKASDFLIPREESCAICHEIERDKPDKQVEPGQPRAHCSLCHPGWDGKGQPPRVVIPTPNLKFNHKVHVAKKIRCQTCHGDLLEKQVHLATREHLPRMPLCLKCHDSRQASATCTTCHLGEAGGFMKTEFAEGQLLPSGVLRGDAHDMKFRTEHARVAASDQKYCASCHRRDFCVDCHNGVVKPLDFHGNDYISMHAVDARRNTPDCSACHRRQTFCTGCHERSGVAPTIKSSEFVSASLDPAAGRHFHLQGWFTGFDVPRQGTHHSFDAQRNIRACASCHREEFCMGCHQTTVNPHPANWRGSARCEALRARAGRMCLRCHIDAADARCD